MRQGRLPRYIAGAAVLLLHALAVLALLSAPDRTQPPTPQFVSLWPDDPVTPDGKPVPPPGPLPQRANAPREESPPDVVRAVVPAPSSPSTGQIDWQREAVAVAKNLATDDHPQVFGRPAPVPRKPCKPKDSVWFYEPKRPELPPGAVALGKHCVLNLPVLVCTVRLGSVEMDTEELITSLREDGGPSVPDPELCD
jgi:hypothetical protein